MSTVKFSFLTNYRKTWITILHHILCKVWRTHVKTIRKIQEVFGEETMGITQIKEWYNHFTDVHTSVQCEERPVRPLTSQNEDPSDADSSNHHQKTCMQGGCQNWIRSFHYECGLGFQENLSNPTKITCDESWVYRYDPETKLQSSQWKHPTFPRT